MSESEFLDRTWARNEKTASDEHERSLCPTETGYDEQECECDYIEEAFRIIAGKLNIIPERQHLIALKSFYQELIEEIKEMVSEAINKMRILEIRSSLYPGSMIKIPLGISKSALNGVMAMFSMLRDDYKFRGMKQGVKLFFSLVALLFCLCVSYFTGYDRGSENGYKAALLDVYRGYNTSTPIVIAGAGGEGRLWKR